MRICVVGTGYVGLVTGACLADVGHVITCVDADAAKINTLKQGRIPIFEPDLAEMVSFNLRRGRLSFSTDVAAAARGAEAVFIAVGTPAQRGNGHADLSQVKAVASEIAPFLSDDAVVVLKSTVPIGTADEVERIIAEQRPDLQFDVASNPEFLRAGAAVHDFMHPDRLVIGVENATAREVMAGIYQPLSLGETPLLFTSRRSAELIKYSANALLATKIAFINEVADLCEQVDANIGEVSRGVGLDKRIGPDFLEAGPGFGGSCFPKDVLALLTIAEENHVPMRIAESVLVANEVRKRSLARRVASAVRGSLRGKSIALLGLTFKPNTDDMRESPSIALVAGLRGMDANIRAYEPAGTEQARTILGDDIAYCTSEYEAARGAEALVLVTHWPQFRTLDFEKLKRIMRAPVVVDLRNAYRAKDMVSRGFKYVGIGMPAFGSSTSVERETPGSRRGGRRSNGYGKFARENGTLEKGSLVRISERAVRSS